MSPLVLRGAALLLTGALGTALAQAPAAAGDHGSPPGAAAPASAAAGQGALSEGEITRWDAHTRKLTLRHGEIKSLGMPPMTMVFRVDDARLLAPFQVGDKVRFGVERRSTGYFITRLEAAR